MTTREKVCAISGWAVIASVVMVYEGFKHLSVKLTIAGYIVMVIRIIVHFASFPKDNGSIFGGGDEYGGW